MLNLWPSKGRNILPDICGYWQRDFSFIRYHLDGVDMKILELSESDSVRLEAVKHADHVQVHVEDDWAGDSESGFGWVCSISLKPDQVRQLVEFLDES